MDHKSYENHAVAVVQAGSSPQEPSHIWKWLMPPVVTHQNAHVDPQAISTHYPPLASGPSSATNPAYVVYGSSQTTIYPEGISNVGWY